MTNYGKVFRQSIADLGPEQAAKLMVSVLKDYSSNAKVEVEQVAEAAGLGQPVTLNGRFFVDVSIQDICTTETVGCPQSVMTRTFNCLQHHGIKTLKDLTAFVAKESESNRNPRSSILVITNFGNKMLDECLVPALKTVLAPGVFQEHFGKLKK